MYWRNSLIRSQPNNTVLLSSGSLSKRDSSGHKAYGAPMNISRLSQDSIYKIFLQRCLWPNYFGKTPTKSLASFFATEGKLSLRELKRFRKTHHQRDQKTEGGHAWHLLFLLNQQSVNSVCTVFLVFPEEDTFFRLNAYLLVMMVFSTLFPLLPLRWTLISVAFKRGSAWPVLTPWLDERTLKPYCNG